MLHCHHMRLNHLAQYQLHCLVTVEEGDTDPELKPRCSMLLSSSPCLVTGGKGKEERSNSQVPKANRWWESRLKACREG